MPGLSFVQPPELRKRSCPRGRLFANLKLLEYMMKLNSECWYLNKAGLPGK
jgi:hypothetical protein